MRRTFLIVLLLFARSVSAQPTLHVHNGMQEGVYFWIKSEHKTTHEWVQKFIRKDGTFNIALVSPDRFHVAVEDQQHRFYSGGFMPLKQMIAGKPSGTFELGGVFQCTAGSEYVWSQSRRQWIKKCKADPLRTAVTYTLTVDGKSFPTIEAPRSQ